MWHSRVMLMGSDGSCYVCDVAAAAPRFVVATIMSSEAPLDLSILAILRALSEKLGLECTRTREIRFLPVPASIASMKVEVSTSQSIYLSKHGVTLNLFR